MSYRYLFVTLSFVLAACASPSSVVKSVSSSSEGVIEVDAHSNLKSGDVVDVYRLDCQEITRSPRVGGGKSKTCQQKLVGTGSVVRMNSETEATISSERGFTLESGMIVKKKD